MSSWGNALKLSIFGESHGAAIGVVIDGLPSGEAIDLDLLEAFMRRRAPGQSSLTTQRREADVPQVLSGLYRGRTTGTPLCIQVQNTDTRSQDYDATRSVARPGHADYTGFLRYSGYNDPNGSGHFSGRVTAGLAAAGGICLQILERRGVHIGAHIASIHQVEDEAVDSLALDPQQLKALSALALPVFSHEQGEQMRQAIEQARGRGDSVGGVIECFALGFPAGIGSPMFDGIENSMASILFGIPAVKGVSFGDGFAAAGRTGSQNNDPFTIRDGKIRTTSNHHGGILGGISSGMPIVVQVAIKPTPSIAMPQQTVDLMKSTETTVQVKGRHDPCIVPRAVPCVEAAVAVALMDQALTARGWRWNG